MLKRELEVLLNDANLAIKDLEKENSDLKEDNLTLKSRNEALTRFVAAISVSVTGIVEPKKNAIEQIRAALSAITGDGKATLEKISEIINTLPEDRA
jgi:hypothetical protein